MVAFMKTSNYNIIFDYNNEKLAFNSMTCAFARVDREFLFVLDCINQNKPLDNNSSNRITETIDFMKKGGFIIEDCFDEIDYLKYKNLHGKFQANSYSLAIAPTFSCNFACPYCYEKTNDTFMTTAVIDAICKEIQQATKQKRDINISWFGGEPLLAKSIIWDLSDRFLSYASETGVHYSAQMITNGYLLDDTTIESCKKYNINRIQVTLDGPSYVHNSRRKLKNSSQGTFNTIVRNVKKALKAGINVAIRINVDSTNEEYTDELLDVLLENGLNNAYVYLGHLKVATEHCQSIENICFEKKEFALKFVDFERLLINKGFNAFYYPNYPKTKSNNCTADSISSKVVAPDGKLYKCWHDLSFPEMSIGSISSFPSFPNEHQVMTQVKYILSNPFRKDECLKCSVLPICMGGCPSITTNLSCQNCKYSLIETLKLEYDILTRQADSRNNTEENNNQLGNNRYLVEPQSGFDDILNTENNCLEYNYSCGSPKRWWSIVDYI